MPDNNSTPTRIIGGTLIASAVATLFLMLHHPTLGTPGFHSLADEVSHEGDINQLVHGAMIVIMLVYFLGMQLLGRLIGNERWDVTAGLIAFALATAMMILAPLMSGFLITELAHSFIDAAPAEEAIFASLVNFSHAMNQVFANTGVVAYGAGMAFFALSLVQRQGFERLAGFAGLVIGLVLMAGILTGHIHLDVHGMMAVAAGMGIWFGLAGIIMMHQKNTQSA